MASPIFFAERLHAISAYLKRIYQIENSSFRTRDGASRPVAQKVLNSCWMVRALRRVRTAWAFQYSGTRVCCRLCAGAG
jgi:hypothetical protein